MAMYISGLDVDPNAVRFYGKGIECVVLSREGNLLFSNAFATEEDIAECRSLLESVKWPPEGIDVSRAYIRFGALPENGFSLNHVTGEKESGVSAFDCTWDLRKGAWRIIGSSVLGAALLGNMLDYHVYLLYGDEVGTGSDGEPVLQNPQVVEELRATSNSPFCLNYVQREGSLREETEAARDAADELSGQEDTLSLTKARDGLNR